MLFDVTQETSEARERVLNTAEALFQQHGYQAVTMRDLARALEMRQASLYYHAPQGKEQLFVEVTQRGLARHRAGIEGALAEAHSDLTSQLMAVAGWFASQPSMNLMSMFEADMLAISPERAQVLMDAAYAALFMPLTRVFETAVSRGEIRSIDPDHMAGLFLTMLDGIMYTTRARHTRKSPETLACEMIDILLYGLKPRKEHILAQ